MSRNDQFGELMEQFTHLNGSASDDDENGVSELAFTVDWAKVVFSIVICIVGLVGNSMTIFVIVILREYKKSVTHWYVLQLSVADTIFLLTLPFKANEDLNNQWIYPLWMCKAKESILFLNYYASILFLMIMSVDRYIAVCHTFSEFLQKFRRQFAASVITLITWVIALLLCTPFAMYSTKTGVDPNCKCEYEFSLAPKPVNYTEQCYMNKVGATFLEKCLLYAAKADPDPSFCRKPDHNLLAMIFQEEEDMDGSSFNFTTEYESGDYGNVSYEFPSVEYYDQDEYTDDDVGGSFGYMTTNESSLFNDTMSEERCDYSGTTHTWRAIIYFNFFGMFVVPLMVMLMSYGLIIARLRSTRVKSTNLRQSTNTNNQGRKGSTRSDRDRRRVTIMCATLVLSFTLCWVLFHATHLARMIGIRGSERFCYVLGAVGGLLGYLNSALNPYLYSFLGTNFSRRWSEATRKFSSSFGRGTDLASGTRLHYFAASNKRKSRTTTAAAGDQSQTAVTRMNRSQMMSENQNSVAGPIVKTEPKNDGDGTRVASNLEGTNNDATTALMS